MRNFLLTLGLLTLGAAAAALAQSPTSSELSPELELLARVKLHELKQLQRQPNYTCVETVERSQRAAVTKRFQLVDTLRLEVALVGGKELYAWPGSKKFEDTELIDMVQRGAIGNGAFGLHARSVFEGRSATHEHRGEESMGGETLLRWDYKVPRLLSGYQIRVSQRKAVVGYHGSFWADPKSLDLRRLQVFADDIPTELGLASASDQVDYARVKIGDGDFLLPSASELRMVDLAGSESRNHIRFTSCRQYSGESVISFADPSPDTTASPEVKPVREVELPAGAAVVLGLAESIELRSAAVGDPIQARLQGDLKVKGQLLLPKNAVASGRITSLLRHTEYTSIGLTFTEIEAEGLHASVKLKLDSVIGLGRANTRGTAFHATPPGPGEGTMLMPATQPRLLRGTLMYWRKE